MPATHIFVDTNLFLHFNVWDIDWKTLAGSKAVVLEITDIVLAELDKHKNQHPRRGLRERAATAIRRLRASVGGGLSAEITAGVAVSISPKRPSIDFDRNHLDSSIPDDVLLGCAIVRRDLGEQAIVATNDYGLELKAQHHGLRVVAPPASAKLPDALDEEDKKLKKLEAELQAERNRRPLLKLRFAQGGDGDIERAVYPPKLVTRERIDAKMTMIRAQHTPLGQTYGGITGHHPFWNQPTQAAIDRYHINLQAYYKAYEDYLPKLYEAQNVGRASIAVSIVLENIGQAPADDIDVKLVFPEGVLATAGRSAETTLLPVAPIPPKKPKAVFLWDIEARQPSILGPAIDVAGLLQPREQPNVVSEVIYVEERLEVRTNIRRLKHGSEVDVAGVCRVQFETYEAAHSFSIDCSVSAANIAAQLMAKLHIHVVRKDNGSPPRTSDPAT